MAACMLCRRLPRLRCLRGLRKDFVQAQHVNGKAEDETGEQEGKTGALQNQESSLQVGYRLHYNPSSYHHSVWNPASSQSQTDNDEDEQCFSTLATSFWQQRNHYSVSCSRYLSSSKNILFDLAFNKGPEPKMPLHSPQHRKPILPDGMVNSRAFLECRPEYVSMSLDLNQRPPPIEWDQAMLILKKVNSLRGNMKPSAVSQFLVELGRLRSDRMSLMSSDQRFIKLLQYSVENLRLFTQHQLLEVLQSFVWLDMSSSRTVLELYEAELSRRANEMTLHQLLLTADLWRCMRRHVPLFLQHLYDSVHLYWGQMGVPELVQLLYIIGERRQCPTDMIHPIEQLLLRHLKQLHPEEVGAVCLGLFKSQISISESAVTAIVSKAHSFVEEMSDFAMVNVLKFLRFSYLIHKPWLEAMAQEVPRRAHRINVEGLMHVALACSALHYRNDDILMAIAERVPSLAPHCRSKDSCKLLWSFGTLGYLPNQIPNFYPSLIESARERKAEFKRYPEHLLTGLLGLAFVSQFPEDLIALALSPDFINLALKSKQLELKKDLFTLNETVALELPQWTGPRLSCELREEVVEMLWSFVQSDVCRKPEVQIAEFALQDLLGGEEFVCTRMILPHTRSIDLEVHLDSNGQPIPLTLGSHTATESPKNSSSKFPSKHGFDFAKSGVTITDKLLAQLTNTKNTTDPLAPAPTVKTTSSHRVQPDDDGRLFDIRRNLTSVTAEVLTKPSSTVKLAIQVINRNHCCYHSSQLLGLHAMKRRQLKLAGYKVVELSHLEWFPLLRKSRTEKLTYLYDKIYNSL